MGNNIPDIKSTYPQPESGVFLVRPARSRPRPKATSFPLSPKSYVQPSPCPPADFDSFAFSFIQNDIQFPTERQKYRKEGGLANNSRPRKSGTRSATGASRKSPRAADSTRSRAPQTLTTTFFIPARCTRCQLPGNIKPSARVPMAPPNERQDVCQEAEWRHGLSSNNQRHSASSAASGFALSSLAADHCRCHLILRSISHWCALQKPCMGARWMAAL